jgi:hypothetical protein
MRIRPDLIASLFGGNGDKGLSARSTAARPPSAFRFEKLADGRYGLRGNPETSDGLVSGDVVGNDPKAGD